MASGNLYRGSAQAGLTPPPTIFALATGAPPTAIAIIRISGAAAFEVAATITGRALPPARQLARRNVFDPANDDPIDHGLLVAFPSPDSATGDDVIELHLHGGTAVVAAILGALRRMGLSPAGPGGFTRRAFDNGKLDLGQVEAVGDLVAAETTVQRRAALARSGSDLFRQVDGWRSTLMAAVTDVEATLDFAEEDGVDPRLSLSHRAAMAALTTDLRSARAASARVALLNNGVTVAIVGPVNAGKSTLLNRLAGRDAAMVSPYAGTTRDLVEVRRVLGGVPVTLIDTAGLRLPADPLEAEGIRRGVERAAASDIVVALGTSDRRDAIRVAPKCDLEAGDAGWRDDVLHLSALTGAGVALLEDELSARIEAMTQPDVPAIVAHDWQLAALADAAEALDAAIVATDTVLVAHDLRQAISSLERLIGRVATEDVLDQIFARFCIGK